MWIATRCVTDKQMMQKLLSAFPLLMRGLDERSIASELFRTRSTVNGHIAAVYRSFGVSSRSELMAPVISGSQSLRS
jgi:DNA-binding NarL/FixJ family response regulator